MSELLRQIVGLKDAIQIVVVFAIGSFYAGYNWKTPQPDQPRTLVRKLDIATCKAHDANSPIFHDSAISLKEDMGNQKSEVFVASSAQLGRYGQFTWVVERVREMTMYTPHMRSAYLLRTDVTGEFYRPLRWRREGETFSIDVPDSEPTDKVVLLIALSSTQEIPSECTRLLQATVAPPHP